MATTMTASDSDTYLEVADVSAWFRTLSLQKLAGGIIVGQALAHIFQTLGSGEGNCERLRWTLKLLEAR